MNGNEDSNNIASIFPEYTEVFEFLEHDLGLERLTDKQKHELGRAIKEAHAAYTRTEITPYQRGELIKGAVGASDQLKRNIGAILADSPLCHFSFSPIAGSTFDINRMMRLQSEVSEFNSWVVAAQHNDFVSFEKPLGRQTESDEFVLLVLYLREGWQQVLGRKATTSSSNRGECIRFRGKDVDIGTRGGFFPYFVYVVHSMVGNPEIVGQYGDKVEAALKKVRAGMALTNKAVLKNQ